MAIGEEALLKELANKVAQSFGKELSKHMSAKAISDSMKDSEKSSYKDESDKPSILEYKGTIMAVRELQKNVHSLERSFRPFGDRLVDATKSLKNFLPHTRAQQAFQSIMEGAQEYADSQRGIYKELAQQTIDYIKDKGTDLGKIDDTAVSLNNFREELHKLYSTVKDSGKISNEQAEHLRETMNSIRDVKGNHIRITEQLSEREQEVWEDILHNRKTHGRDIEKTLLERKKVVEKISAISEEMGESISVAGIYASKGLKEAADNFRQASKNIMRGSLIAVGVGATQIIEDSIRAYQFILGREYKALSVLMGMSQREVQQGFSDFRDVIRMESVILGEGVFSSAVEDQIHHIQKLGKHHLLMGEEAFRYGMLMKDAARRLGISNDMNEKEMNRFYGETAAKLGMHISEFGDFFNAMAQDPSFVGFVNNIRTIGADVQEQMQNELEQRIRMNKAMGLTTEHLKERLRLEQARKYASITEKFQAKIGAKLLMNQMEKELGLSFSPEQRDAMEAHEIAPQFMTDRQKEIYSGLEMVLSSATQLYNAKINEQLEGVTGAQRDAIIKSALVPAELFRTFAEKTGTYSDMDRGELILSAMSNLSDGTMNLMDVATQIAGGDEEMSKALIKKIDAISGKTELGDIKDATENSKNALFEMRDVLEIWNKGKETLSGIGQSGIVKLLGGVGAGALQMGVAWYQLRALKNIVGLSKAAGTAAGALSTFGGGAAIAASGGTVMGLAAKFGRLMTGVGLLTVAFNELTGNGIGRWIYDQSKDKDWFTEGVDNMLNNLIPDQFKPVSQEEVEEREMETALNFYKTRLRRIGNYTEEMMASMSKVEIARRAGELEQYEQIVKKLTEGEITADEFEQQTGRTVEEILGGLEEFLKRIDEKAQVIANKTTIVADETVCTRKEEIAQRIDKQKEFALGWKDMPGNFRDQQTQWS